MYATNIRDLKKNPSAALRQAELGPVLILKRNQPNALLLHLDKSLFETQENLRPALAASLYQDNVLSLGASAKLADLTLTDFVNFLENLGIDIVKVDETTDMETKDVSQWLKK